MQKGYLKLNRLLNLIKNLIKNNSTLIANLLLVLIYAMLWFISFIIGDLIKPILTIITLIWISIYWYTYKCSNVLTVKKFLFGYKERNDLCGSDAFFFRVLSSEFFKIMKSYPITMVYIILWYLPLITLLKFWDVIKNIIDILSLLDILGFLNYFEDCIKNLASNLAPYMLAYKEETQIVVNIVYLLILWIVTYTVCLRIKLSKFEDDN